MSRYTRKPSAADYVGALIVILLVMAVSFLFAFLFIGVPMILFQAPTWAWLGCSLLGMYAGTSSRTGS